MPVKCLTEDQKDQIVGMYNAGEKQTVIASATGTSTRTVQRALYERGVLTPHMQAKEETEVFMRVIRKHGITPEQLELIIHAPALTHNNVQQFLNNCTRDVLAEMFYISGLVKIGELLDERKIPVPSTQHAQPTQH